MSATELFTICRCGAEIEPMGSDGPAARAWIHVATGSAYCHPGEVFAVPRDGDRDARNR